MGLHLSSVRCCVCSHAHGLFKPLFDLLDVISVTFLYSWEVLRCHSGPSAEALLFTTASRSFQGYTRHGASLRCSVFLEMKDTSSLHLDFLSPFQFLLFNPPLAQPSEVVPWAPSRKLRQCPGPHHILKSSPTSQSRIQCPSRNIKLLLSSHTFFPP